MGEEGAAKLRLKPRSALGPRGRGGTGTGTGTWTGTGTGTGPRRPTSTDRWSWFEKDLNECERTWMLLLEDTGQGLHCTNWDTVPSFPEFLGKRAEKKSPGPQETFTAGMKDFQWVPFPSFHKENPLNPEDLSWQQPAQSHSNQSQPGQAQAEQLCSFSSTAEKTCRRINTDQVGEDTGGIPNLEVGPKSQKVPGHVNSAQSSAKACVPQQQHTGTAQSRAEGEGHGDKELQGQPEQGRAAGGDRGVSVEEPPGPCERLQNQSQGSSALDSCPMCLMQFSGRLSQLDIDGHLAKCLSESAEDVMW